MSRRPDKIYFNITINYNENKLISKERNTSIAQTDIDIIDPLVENTNLYDLCISKFRLDTLTIPLVIPELKQPQKIVDSKIELDFWVKLLRTDEFKTKKETKVNPETQQEEEVDVNVTGEQEYTVVKQKYLTLTPKNYNKKCEVKENDKGKQYLTMKKGYEFEKPCIRKDSTDNTLGYINNLNPFCYIYEPQEFLDSINRAIIELFYDDKEEDEDGDETMDGEQEKEEGTEDAPEQESTPEVIDNLPYAFFKLSGSTLTYYQKAAEIPFIILFSPNLYKYFGAPFNTKRIPSEEGWSICVDADSRNIRNKSTNAQYLAFNDNINYTGNVEDLDESDKYWNIATSDIAITQTWNACKTILICSNSLPVRGEYMPISEKDGLLIHENTEIGRKSYLEFHENKKDASKLGENSIKTPSVKVLESYYPMSSSGGDMRTQIIYTNDSIDTGTKLSLQGENASLKKFDICVKWVDVFNNMHDLELMPNCSCDIRVAFVKKAAKQDLILTGFKQLLSALGYTGDNGGPAYKKPRRYTNSSSLPGGGFKFNLDEFT